MRCLYCGQNALIIPGNPYMDTVSSDPYKCENCGVKCSKAEVDLDGERLRKKGLILKAYTDPSSLPEETILHDAWNLMQKFQWDTASEPWSI